MEQTINIKEMRKICFVSGSRADYGLLHNLMKFTKKSKKIKFQLIVTGMHLEAKFGNTFKFTSFLMEIVKIVKSCLT